MSRFKTFLSAALVAGAGCALPGAGGGGQGESTRAVTCPPADLFESALCLCGDFNDVGLLEVREGPSGPGAVGINGFARFVNAATISGSLTAYSGFHAVGALDLGLDVLTNGDASWVGLLHVPGDFSVGGDILGVGLMEVDGTLRVGGDAALIPGAKVGGRGDYVAPAGPPCACDPDTFFDVEAAVAAARTANDNAAAGLPTRLAAVGVSNVVLEDGMYYFEDAASVGLVHLTIAGEVSIYVDGNIALVGAEHISLEPGATLDLYVSGNVATVGAIKAGSSSDPQAFRLYVGGGEQVVAQVGLQAFYGSIYAPEAQLAYVGGTKIVGSIFADSLHGVGLLSIEYGAPVDLDPDSCEPENPQDPDDGGDDPQDPDDGGDDPQDPGDDGDDPQDPGDPDGPDID